MDQNKMMNQAEMISFFRLFSDEVKCFKKVSTVKAKIIPIGQEVVTTIDGVIETRNIATENSILVEGPSGEQYIVSVDKFNERYSGNELNNEFKTFEAKGECYAFKYEGENTVFMAPWGETMILNKGDYLASPNQEVTEVYRIEEKVFKLTYALKN